MASNPELANNCSESSVGMNRKLAALKEENALLKQQLEGLIIQKEIKTSETRVFRRQRRNKQNMKKKDAIAMDNGRNPNMTAGKTKVPNQSEKVTTGLKKDEEQNTVSSQSEIFSTIKKDKIIGITSKGNVEDSGNRHHETSNSTPDEPDSIFPSLRSILNWVLYDKFDSQEADEPENASQKKVCTDSKTVLDTAGDDSAQPLLPGSFLPKEEEEETTRRPGERDSANMKDEKSDEVRNGNGTRRRRRRGCRGGRGGRIQKNTEEALGRSLRI